MHSLDLTRQEILIKFIIYEIKINQIYCKVIFGIINTGSVDIYPLRFPLSILTDSHCKKLFNNLICHGHVNFFKLPYFLKQMLCIVFPYEKKFAEQYWHSRIQTRQYNFCFADIFFSTLCSLGSAETS